ncbi:hypothetical protein L228DRAFT_82162 [Xylona heveae TC161]|uniref:Secreted protein n=1 Tax=Xylona heveae (strain CBS 132557 / TC161) TaxID=1328760 RepID=A0A165J492_XYLHT|nr:hypothetical protein L228DRAFT_82162 [Xylona heveae TC161]KZF25709.1 hypothetical protein L228DRAFT_82162 [Xylona heveae TC161]
MQTWMALWLLALNLDKALACCRGISCIHTTYKSCLLDLCTLTSIAVAYGSWLGLDQECFVLIICICSAGRRILYYPQSAKISPQLAGL